MGATAPVRGAHGCGVCTSHVHVVEVARLLPEHPCFTVAVVIMELAQRRGRHKLNFLERAITVKKAEHMSRREMARTPRSL